MPGENNAVTDNMNSDAHNINSNTNNDESKNPTQYTGQKRVINKIVLDLKKLQQSGLDRQLAEALSKQKHLTSKKSSKEQQMQLSTMEAAAQQTTTESSLRSASSVSPDSANAAVANTTTTTATATTSALAQKFLIESQGQSQGLHNKTPTRNMVPPKITITKPVDTHSSSISTSASGASVKSPPLDLIDSKERLEHAKILLKKKLLRNKSQQEQKSICSDPETSHTALLTTTSSFTKEVRNHLAIPKANIGNLRKSIVKKKPPVILNFSNQINKSISCRSQTNQTTATICKKSFETVFASKSSINRPYPICLDAVMNRVQETPVGVSQIPGGNLIVLENKVLSQAEKIDLSALRLHGTIELDAKQNNDGVQATNLASNQADTLVKINSESATLSVAPPSPLQPLQAVSTKSSQQSQKIILSAAKLKRPPEEIAALAKQIQNKLQTNSKSFNGGVQKPLPKFDSLKNISRKKKLLSLEKGLDPTTSRDRCESSTSSISNMTTASNVNVQSIKKQDSDTISIENSLKNCEAPFMPSVTLVSAKAVIEDTLAQLNKKEFDFQTSHNHNLKQEKPIVFCKDNNSTIGHFNNMETNIREELVESAAYVASSPVKDCIDFVSSPSSKSTEKGAESQNLKPKEKNAQRSSNIISAVDFIAALAASNPITETTSMELSPEELNLNATFAMGFSPLHLPDTSHENINSVAKTSLEEVIEHDVPDLEIGKILPLNNVAILDATLDEADNNILCIRSPKEVKQTRIEEVIEKLASSKDEEHLRNVPRAESPKTVIPAVISQSKKSMATNITVKADQFAVLDKQNEKSSKEPFKMTPRQLAVVTALEKKNPLNEKTIEENVSLSKSVPEDKICGVDGSFNQLTKETDEHDTSKDLIKSAPGESTKVVEIKRTSRYKKGKINLVQRSKKCTPTPKNEMNDDISEELRTTETKPTTNEKIKSKTIEVGSVKLVENCNFIETEESVFAEKFTPNSPRIATSDMNNTENSCMPSSSMKKARNIETGKVNFLSPIAPKKVIEANEEKQSVVKIAKVKENVDKHLESRQTFDDSQSALETKVALVNSNNYVEPEYGQSHLPFSKAAGVQVKETKVQSLGTKDLQKDMRATRHEIKEITVPQAHDIPIKVKTETDTSTSNEVRIQTRKKNFKARPVLSTKRQQKNEAASTQATTETLKEKLDIDKLIQPVGLNITNKGSNILSTAAEYGKAETTEEELSKDKKRKRLSSVCTKDLEKEVTSAQLSRVQEMKAMAEVINSVDTNLSERLESVKRLRLDNEPERDIDVLLRSPIKDSCTNEDDCSQDESFKRIACKRLRKTLERHNKKCKSPLLQESDDDGYNEFLGFEEEPVLNPIQEIMSSSLIEQSNGVTNPTTSKLANTLKNWLTTGKAASPTKQLASFSDSSSNRGIPPKKRREPDSEILFDESTLADITDVSTPIGEDYDPMESKKFKLIKNIEKEDAETVSAKMKLNKPNVISKDCVVSPMHVEEMNNSKAFVHMREQMSSYKPDLILNEVNTSIEEDRAPESENVPANLSDKTLKAPTFKPKLRSLTNQSCDNNEKTETEKESKCTHAEQTEPTLACTTSIEIVVKIGKKRGRKPKLKAKGSVLEPVEKPCTSMDTLNGRNTPRRATRKGKLGRAQPQRIERSLSRSMPAIEETNDNGEGTSLTGQPVRRRRLQRIDSTELINSTNDNLGEMSVKMPTETREEVINSTAPVRKRVGRKPKFAVSNEEATARNQFNPRLLLIRKREQLHSTEDIEVASGTGPIQCGLCMAHITKATWVQHQAEHYGIGWIIGETPLNLESRTVVLATMTNFFRKTGIKGITCRLCERLYRSSLGLLNHLEMCGEVQPRMECEYCKRSYTKSTYIMHVRTCNARVVLEMSNEVKAEVEKSESKAPPDILNNSGRAKRISTLKAETKLKRIGNILKSADMQSFQPKLYVRYQPTLDKSAVHAQWSKDLKKFGKGFCVEKICKFSSSDLSTLEAHLTTCNQLPKTGYHCKYCKEGTSVFSTENKAIKHVMKEHNPRADFETDGSDYDVQKDKESSDEYLSSDESSSEDDPKTGEKHNSQKVSNLSKSKVKVTQRKVFCSGNSLTLFPGRQKCLDYDRIMTDKWQQFTEVNYSDKIQYSYALPHYKMLDTSFVEKYLPQQSLSMKFSYSKANQIPAEFGVHKRTQNWSQLARYESINVKDEHIMYIGAAVRQVAWVPLPADITEQFLVCSYRKCGQYTRYANAKIKPDIIMILQFSTLNLKAWEIRSRIHYGLLIPEGPVQCFSLLPSGGYSSAANRLGLLAVGCASANIKIYALPLKLDKEQNKHGAGFPLIELPPALVLTFSMHECSAQSMLEMQCLQICWSESKSHNLIVAGFANGLIGFWDIEESPEVESRDSLNLFMVENVRHYVPLHFFYFGEKNIRHLALHYDNSGPRWLAVASAMRQYRIYDIRNWSAPQIVSSEGTSNLYSCLDWSPLWETVTLGFYNAQIARNTRAVSVNPVGIGFVSNTLDNIQNTPSTAHYSPKQFVQVFGTDNGDVIFLNTRELHLETSFAKTIQNNRAVSMLDLQCLTDGTKVTVQDAELSAATLHEADFRQKYGIIIHPLLKVPANKKKIYLGNKRHPPAHLLTYLRVNCVRYNCNQTAAKWMAVGLENGFVRVINFTREAYFEQFSTDKT